MRRLPSSVSALVLLALSTVSLSMLACGRIDESQTSDSRASRDPEDGYPPQQSPVDAPARPPAVAAPEAPVCRVSAQGCGCDAASGAPGGGGGGGGGIGLCEQLAMECSTLSLLLVTPEVASNVCTVAPIDFDALPDGPLPADFLPARGIRLVTRADCPPVVAPRATDPTHKALVTCAAALGDVRIQPRGGRLLGLTFDRPGDSAGQRGDVLLRAYRGVDVPVLPDFVAPTGARLLRSLGHFAFTTTFPPDAPLGSLIFTPVWPDMAMNDLWLGVPDPSAGAPPATCTTEPAELRIASLLSCAGP